jgi:hypothetical protein
MAEVDLEKSPTVSDAITVADNSNNNSPPPSQGIFRSETSWSMGSYPKLSRYISQWPDVAMFRRFSALNAENLLFLQAEISHLEVELRDLRDEENKKQDVKGMTAPVQRNWLELSQPNEDGEYCEQWELILKIREKLKEYSKLTCYLMPGCSFRPWSIF